MIRLGIMLTGDTLIPVGKMEINALDKLVKLSTSVKLPDHEPINLCDLMPSDDESEPGEHMASY